MAAKSSSLPAVIGLLVLALVGGGAYWILTSEEPAPQTSTTPATIDQPKVEEPKAKPATTESQRTELVGTATPFDQPVKVKVVDTTGQVIAGAQVEVREDVEPLVAIQKLVAAYQTGADGTVVVKGSRAPYTIAAEAARHIKVFQPIRLPVKDTTIELPTGGALNLTFKDEVKKEPVPDVPVKLYADLGGKPNPGYYFISTKGTDKGTLKIAPVPQVEFTLGINHPDYDPIDENYKVGPTEQKDIAVLLKLRITLTGHVVAALDGKPIKGAKVEVAEGAAPNVSKSLGMGSAHIRAAETDEFGKFTVEKCPVGTLYIDASHADYVTASKGPVESDTLKDTNIEIRMDRNSAIRGHVVDADQNPVAGAEVVPVFAQNPFFEQQLAEQRKNAIKSGPDGAFELKGLQPNLEWKLHTYHKDYLEAVSESVNLRPGEAKDEMVIRLMKGGTISGAVKDSAGNPLQDAEIVAVLATTDKSAQARTPAIKSAADGSYAISGLKPGVYNLEANLDGYCKELKRGVRYNANEVVITLLKEAVIVGQVLSAADRSPVIEFTVRYRQSGIPVPQTAGLLTVHNKEGKFEVHGLKPGLYDIEVKSKDFSPKIVTAVPVQEGKPSETIIVLMTQGSSLEGMITQASHDPINRALVELDPLEMFDAKDKDYITLRGTSDETGRFVIGKLLPGRYRLTVTHPKFANVKPIDVEVQDGTNRQDVILRGGATVSVYVRDDKGEPVSGARVMLRDKGRQYMSAPGNRMRLRRDTPFMSMDGGAGPMGRHQTNKDGFIMFRRMDAGEYELMVTGDKLETFRKDLTLEYEKEYVEQVSVTPKETK